MRKIIVLFLLANLALQAQNISFPNYFTSKTMRVDYIHTGGMQSESVFLQEIKQEPFWGGSQINLIDTFGYGEYSFRVYDKASGQLIYSKGYNTLFQEWKTYPEAKEIQKSFYESICFPYPQKEIKLEILKREKGNKYNTIFSYSIKPNDFMIKKEKPIPYESFKILYNGESKNKVDIVFLFDGYSQKDSAKLYKDAERFANYLWSYSPFKENKERFNIWGIASFSAESGTDIPGENIWKNTLFNTSFYTFRTERYLTTQDVKTVRDVAANVPYDQIYIIVNTDKYGGGGIYNFWNIVAADNYMAKYVFLHEFGHGFAGLADEYVDEGTPQDFYEKNIEPWEPNITNLVNFEKKWKKDLAPKTPIPTPENDTYKDSIGVFEGAGYVAKGIYRAYQNCEMRSLKQGFCPVCKNAITNIILFNSK